MIMGRAVGLFLALLTARLAMLAGAHIPVSMWTLPAFLWQDVLAALLFALLDRVIHRNWAGWALYAAAVLYVSVNAGIARALYSPLTWNMLRAAGGPLADSAWSSLTPANVSAVALTALTGVVAPALWRRFHLRLRPAPLVVCGVALALIGPYATTKVDTAGRYRNAFGALWPVSAPTAGALSADSSGDWRTSPLESAPSDDLTPYRGQAAGRNVLIIVLESTAAQYLHAYGADLDPTPNLTAASDGLIFENAFAVYPESIKGLFSILCSRYPAFNDDAQTYASIRCPALPERLRAAGYQTALIHSGRFMFLGMNAVVENRGFDILEDAATISGNHESSFGIDEPAAVDRLLAFIDSTPPGKPFFAMYLPTAGHHPYATPSPGPFKDDGGIGSYRNALHYGDESLGVLFDGLRRRGLADNTLLIVFGDHGEAFGQHEGNFAHTMFIYNENIRTPMLIRAPGVIPNLRIQRPVSLIDIAPTILDLLGRPIPAEYQGATMLDPRPRMALFFTDYSLGWLGLVDGCWKATYETGSRRARLFDLCRDRGENHDLSAAEPELAAAYKARLEQWIAAQ
ncbi:MAG TPA: sulfatase [Terriglobia bacterium]|nr:sulfatase [Terriglobia bacterium]